MRQKKKKKKRKTICSFSPPLSSLLFPPSFGKDKRRCCQECDCIWKTNPAHFSFSFFFSSTGSFFFSSSLSVFSLRWTPLRTLSVSYFDRSNNLQVARLFVQLNVHFLNPRSPCDVHTQPRVWSSVHLKREKSALCVKVLEAVCFPDCFPGDGHFPRHLFISSQLMEV